MLSIQRYAEVILPLPIKGTFTYDILEGEDVSIGQRVVVQFGKRKLYTGLVSEIHKNKPKDHLTKPLLGVLDELPIVNTKQLKLWRWICEYYMCNIGDVMNAALPSSFKLASESTIIIHPDFDGNLDCLNTDECTILEALSENSNLEIKEILFF